MGSAADGTGPIDFERLAAIVDIATEIASADLDLQRVIDLIAEDAKRLTRADIGAVGLVDDIEVVVYGTSSGSDFHKYTRIDIEASLSGAALKMGQILRCHDAESDQRIDRELLARMGMRSALSVPLVFDGQVFGVANVLSRTAYAFTDADVHTLQLIAGLLAAAVAHAAEYQARRESEERYRAIISSLQEGIISYDASGDLRSCNDSAERILGLTREQIAHPKLRPAGWQTVKENGDSFPQEEWPISVTLRTGEAQSNVIMGIVKPIGPTTWITVNAYPMLGGDSERPNEAVTSFADITSLKESQHRLLHMAQHDGLTGLPNRSLLTDRLEQAIKRARRYNELIGVLYIDLDGFKNVNDTRGHAAGDELLRTVAKRMTSIVRPSDTVARLAGDEFAVLLPALAEPSDAAHVGEKLREAVGRPVELFGEPFHVQASVGIAVYPNEGETSAELLERADAAMYRDKFARAR